MQSQPFCYHLHSHNISGEVECAVEFHLNSALYSLPVATWCISQYFIPHTCAGGKGIGSVHLAICLSLCQHKITKSGVMVA